MQSVPRIVESVSSWQPNSILPAELSQQTGVGRIPEVRLLIAVLEDALQCIVRNIGAGTSRHRRQFKEAYEWVFEEDQEQWPFAFENVCGVLGLDPAAVRLRVRQILMSNC